jgi:phosphoglycerate dehydrogenase-like enzyme
MMKVKPVIAVLLPPRVRAEFLPAWLEKKLRSFAQPVMPEQDGAKEDMLELLPAADGCLTSWASPRLTVEDLDRARKLRIVAHAAGTIRPYVPIEAFDRGIVVTSAAGVIATYVAEMTLALAVILLRRAVQHDRAMREKRTWGDESLRQNTDSLIRTRVGLVGFGRVAREFVRLLRPFKSEVLAFDPYASAEVAEMLRVRLTSLEELMSQCRVVSIHAANLPQTRHLVGKEELALLQDGAVLINTARGAVVDQQALIEELRKRRIWAALDVFDPEPPPPDSELRDLPNAVLTPHIAGPAAERRWELTAHAVNQLRRFFSGKPPIDRVTKGMLDWTA